MSGSDADGSVARVRDALLAAGHEDTIETFPGGTRTAEDAAAAVGCTVAQIAKSMIFRSGDRPALMGATRTSRLGRRTNPLSREWRERRVRSRGVE